MLLLLLLLVLSLDVHHHVVLSLRVTGLLDLINLILGLEDLLLVGVLVLFFSLVILLFTVGLLLSSEHLVELKLLLWVHLIKIVLLVVVLWPLFSLDLFLTSLDFLLVLLLFVFFFLALDTIRVLVVDQVVSLDHHGFVVRSHLSVFHDDFI